MKVKWHDDSPVFEVGDFTIVRERTGGGKERWRLVVTETNILLSADQTEDLADVLDEALAWAEEQGDQGLRVSGG